jgi:hypothetical protein
MTWIEVNCPECGPVECQPADFELAVCNVPSSSYYAVTCPVCHTRIQKTADERAIELLIAEGVHPQRWELPAELLESHDGPPFTLDDELDLHLQLQDPNWFEALTTPAA